MSTTLSAIRRNAVPVAVLAIGLNLAAVPAGAAPPTCEGRPVTAAGSTGTDGDDVLVVGSAGTADPSGGAGNDLICIRGPFHADDVVTVDAGPGDDRVVNESRSGTRITTLLGSGADTYLGNDASEEIVVAGPAPWSRVGDSGDVERDTIDTRGGADTVYSGSTTPGATNADFIALGDGDDALSWAGEQVGPAPDLGVGSNRLALYPGWQGMAFGVDAAQKVATVDARPALRWAGDVWSYRLAVDNRETTFMGTDASEHLTVSRGDTGPGPVVPPLHPDQRRFIDMRGGDDTVAVQDAVVGGSLVGGGGRDTLYAAQCLEAEVRLGGSYSCLHAYQPRVQFVATIDVWEDITVPALSRAEVIGTAGADEIGARGHAVRIVGRGGDDLLVVDFSGGGSSRVLGGRGDDVVRGNTGPDRLVGGPGADDLDGRGKRDVVLGGTGRDLAVGGKGSDRLFGGRGRDKARGQGGTDRCLAEVTRTCERP